MYKVERLGHGGDGIVEGPLFAARTLPGEVIDGQIAGDRLTNIKIIEPSDHRVRAACPAFNRCGGCSLHHVADEFVTNWKSGVVANALTNRGLPVNIRHHHIARANSRRRAKLHGKRTKKGALIGFHSPRSDVLQDITGCMTLHPEIVALIPKLEDFTTGFASRKAPLSFWILVTETGLDVAVDGAPNHTVDMFTELAAWAADAGVARLTLGDEVIVTHVAPRLTFGKVAVTPPPRGFTQAAQCAETFMQTAVEEALSDAGQVADLFSGCGTFGLVAATRAPVAAFEGDADLIAALDFGVRHAQGIKAVQSSVRDLFRNPLIKEDLAKIDGVIIDPPRAGAAAQAAHIADSDVRRVAMVSCNPVTFARDVQTLVEGGFSLDWVDVVDQFRWSPHIEVVSQLTR